MNSSCVNVSPFVLLFLSLDVHPNVTGDYSGLDPASLVETSDDANYTKLTDIMHCNHCLEAQVW